MTYFKAKVSIGDPVEVKVMIRSQGTPPRFEETWLPATVCHVTNRQIGVAFSDGERMALAIGDHAWRFAR